MLEFLDDLVLVTLETEWRKLVGDPTTDPPTAAASLDVWKRSFNEGSIAKHVENAYTQFVTNRDNLVFYHAWNPRLFTLEQYTVAISLDMQATDGEFLGHANFGDASDGLDESDDAYSSRETGILGIYVIAPKKPILSFICYFIRRAILSATPDIVYDLGLDNLHQLRSAAMVAPEEMAPNGVPLVYGRKMELNAEMIDTAERLGGGQVSPKKPFLVHEPRDGIDATVDRETGSETPLGATVFGGVKIPTS